MDESLLRKLQNNTAIPMHMPGHKRNVALAPYLRDLGAAWDITEIDGFDNLHDARGILRDSMDRAAALWGSRRAFYLVNGSSGGILAAVRACVKPGGTVIVGRNCHVSVYNALVLNALTPVYVLPGDPGHGICGPIDPEDVEQALENHPEAEAVILTSPTYDGVCSDVKAIADVTHRHGRVLIVDQAHGAHFGFGHGFPDSAVHQGADVVIQSVHKTLPSLTQTAMLHLCSERVSETALRRALAMFQTTSPSYLLLASLDGCVGLLEREGDDLFTRWQQALDKFYNRCAGLRRLRLFDCSGRDRSKIVVLTDGTALTGSDLANVLRRQYGIEPEMASVAYATAMTGLGDTEETLDALADALAAIDETAEAAEVRTLTAPSLPRMALAPHQAELSDGEHLSPEGSAGRISGEFLWAYPPGVPLLVPGEVIDKAILDTMADYARGGIELRSTTGRAPEKIFVRK